MIWNLNCRKTRRLLALSAGNDLEVSLAPETQRHLAICPHCREIWRGLRHTQQVLERVSAARVEGQTRAVSDPGQVSDRPGEAVWAPPSIWPGVVRHLRVIDEQALVPNWRGWLPSAALAAACLAVVVVTIPDPQFGVRTAESRQPLVIYPQHASVESQGRGVQSFPGTAFHDWERDMPEVGHERPVQLLQGNDEPRSF